VFTVHSGASVFVSVSNYSYNTMP